MYNRLAEQVVCVHFLEKMRHIQNSRNTILVALLHQIHLPHSLRSDQIDSTLLALSVTLTYFIASRGKALFERSSSYPQVSPFTSHCKLWNRPGPRSGLTHSVAAAWQQFDRRAVGWKSSFTVHDSTRWFVRVVSVEQRKLPIVAGAELDVTNRFHCKCIHP